MTYTEDEVQITDEERRRVRDALMPSVLDGIKLAPTATRDILYVDMRKALAVLRRMELAEDALDRINFGGIDNWSRGFLQGTTLSAAAYVIMLILWVVI